MSLNKCLKVCSLIVLLSWNVSSNVVCTVPQCNFKEPVKTGNIQDPELVEASGLVASRKQPGVYYSIQDSLNPDNVYALFENGQELGNPSSFTSNI